jgi:hypothetical protein
LIVILGVGHNAKRIQFMPLVVAGFILVFKKKYVLGGLITLFSTALEINANHFSNDVLPLDFPLILSGYLYKTLRIKNIRRYYILLGSSDCWYFALGANATNLLATSEYTNFSIRGKVMSLLNPDGTKTDYFFIHV